MARYKAAIRPASATSAPMATLADAASLLWRFALHDVGPRPLPWDEVAELAKRRFPRAGLAFADLHATMAEAAMQEAAGLEQRIADLERLAADGKLPQGRVVPAFCRGLAAFARGEHGEAADRLTAAMPELTRIAGSHAQREVFEDTLIAALLACGRSAPARERLAERLARRPRTRDEVWMATTASKMGD
jgi:hypothetical protein